MSDHDAAPDPMDKTYAQAEAALDDEAARAARRARILAAVANEPAGAAVSKPSTHRPAFGPGGWLAAASVAGLSALIAFQIYEPTPIQPSASTAAVPAVPAAPAPGTAMIPEPPARAPVLAGKTEPAPAAVEPRAVTSSGYLPVTPPPPPPPFQAARQPADTVAPAPSAPAQMRAPEAPPAPPPSRRVEEVVVTGSKRAVAGAASPSSEVSEMVVTSERRQRVAPASEDQAARLRDAAAAGRTAAIAALLAKGAPIDATDDDGETALMKAVRANHPGAVALLRRRGASLDLKNSAGESARDMAASVGDAKLDRALGLRP